MSDLNNVELEVRRDVRQVLEHLFWIIGELPENVSTTATRDTYVLFNLKTDKKLTLKVKEE